MKEVSLGIANHRVGPGVQVNVTRRTGEIPREVTLKNKNRVLYLDQKGQNPQPQVPKNRFHSILFVS